MKGKQQKKLKTNGITLIALVVTIVVLLILAGVSINLVLGPNGLITRAQEAKIKTEEASDYELDQMNKAGDYIDTMVGNSETEDEEEIIPYTEVYATLYTDNTLGFSSTNTPIEGKTPVEGKIWNITDDEYVFNDVDYSANTPWYADRERITTVKFADEIVPRNVEAWFADCTNLEEIKNINNLNTSNVSSIKGMFYNCIKLTKIDMSGFNTKKVTNMSHLFESLNAVNMELTEITGLDKLDTSSVTDMSVMFWNCTKLKSLDVSNFDTSNVTNMSCMFGSYNFEMGLEKIIGLNNFDTRNVTDMSSMFYNCTNLESLNLSNFNTSNVTNMYCMFSACGNNNSEFTSLDLSSFNTSNVTDMCGMFEDCTKLTSITFGDNFNTSNVTNMSYMFNRCFALESLDLSKFDTSKVTDMSYMFKGANTTGNALETIQGLENFNTSKVINMAFMFWNCDELENINVSSFDTSNVTDMSGMFGGYDVNMKLKDIIGIEEFNTSKVTSMASMFQNCGNLINLDVNNFDTRNVTNMVGMFWECKALTNIEIGEEFNTENVTDMEGMFYDCKNLTSINLTNFNTAKVTSMKDMFKYCGKLTSLDLTSFDTSKVTDMSGMFGWCNSITQITVGAGWKIDNVSNKTDMFLECGVQNVTPQV